jgi:hypothetical protein
MPWKEHFVQSLSQYGISASESDLPDEPQTIRDQLNQIANWWSVLDDHTKAVLRNSGAEVANGLWAAGFASQWPGLISMLGQNSAGTVLPGTYNAVSYAWNALGQSADVDDEAIRDAVVQQLADL